MYMSGRGHGPPPILLPRPALLKIVKTKITRFILGWICWCMHQNTIILFFLWPWVVILPFLRTICNGKPWMLILNVSLSLSVFRCIPENKIHCAPDVTVMENWVFSLMKKVSWNLWCCIYTRPSVRVIGLQEERNRKMLLADVCTCRGGGMGPLPSSFPDQLC